MTNTNKAAGNNTSAGNAGPSNKPGRLSNKVAIVTGASKGIGAGIAKALAGAGADVVVNYAADKAGADRIVDAIRTTGGNAVAIKGDVSKAADVQNLFGQTRAQYGAVDILVNSAGVYQFGPIEGVTETEFHRQFNINVLGTILTSQEALKYFGSTGSIINVSSIVGSNPVAYASVYAATKSAVESVTRSLAQELGPRNIRVNAIAPGMTETEGLHSTEGLMGGPMEEQMVGRTPLGRMGQPGDITGAAVFLASDDAAWITGETLRVAGGLL